MTSIDATSGGPDPVEAAAREDLRGLFELEQVHRRGPTSLVCLARDLEYNQPVALKIMSRAMAAGADAEEAFHRAAAVAAGLDHPHIVPMYSAGATDRFFWCATQFIEGQSLAEDLRSNRSMEPAECLRVVGHIAAALDSAHRLGVVHGCLTPANVVLDVAGNARVTDFWVPWVLERLGAFGGERDKTQSAKYRAPEQLAEGRCGPEADQYALARLMQTSLVKVPARVPPHMVQAIERALSPAPESRFPNIREFAVALGATSARFSGERIARIVGDDTADQATFSPPSRWRWVLAGTLSLVALGAVVAPWLSSRGSKSAYYPAPPTDSLPLTAAAPLMADTVSRAPAPAPAPAPPQGRLYVNATPWGQVYVDGELIGNTPRVAVPIAPGSHRLRVLRDGFQPFELAIRVDPGQELRFTDIVLQELKP